MKKGKIVVLEGLDGCGKGAQLEKLKEKFPNAVYTREPGGTEFAEQQRLLLFDPKNFLSCRTELLTFFAARSDHWEKVVVPAVMRGQMVICDRADASSFAFQLYGRRAKEEIKGYFWDLRRMVFGRYEPDVYVVLDASAEECQRRLKLASQEDKRKITRFDQEELEFHLRVREGYLEFERQKPDRVVRINGQRPIDEVHAEIWVALTARQLTPA